MKRKYDNQADGLCWRQDGPKIPGSDKVASVITLDFNEKNKLGGLTLQFADKGWLSKSIKAKINATEGLLDAYLRL